MRDRGRTCGVFDLYVHVGVHQRRGNLKRPLDSERTRETLLYGQLLKISSGRKRLILQQGRRTDKHTPNHEEEEEEERHKTANPAKVEIYTDVETHTQTERDRERDRSSETDR